LQTPVGLRKREEEPSSGEGKGERKARCFLAPGGAGCEGGGREGGIMLNYSNEKYQMPLSLSEARAKEEGKRRRRRRSYSSEKRRGEKTLAM